MKEFTTSLFGLLLVSFYAHSQGCIAIRNLTGFGQFAIPEYNEEPFKWLVNANARYSEFTKTYVGSEEVPVPQEDQPYSNTFIVDFAITRIYEKGWSITVDIPIMAASRRTYQEHGGPTGDHVKHTTNSFGIADVRVTAYKWLLDVTQPHKGNIQLGLGLKLPTGDYRYEDFFYKPGRVSAPVNPTLQLGDGGTGFVIEINGFYTINSSLGLYGNLFYLFSPRDINGTESMSPAGSYSPAEISVGANITSVPDAYTIRGGANLKLGQAVIWGGVRWEGVPVNDAIGGSNGQRRAGYSVSVEPGFNYNFKKSTVFLFFPLPIYQTMNQTVPDKELNRPSRGGVTDYLLFLGTVFKF